MVAPVVTAAPEDVGLSSTALKRIDGYVQEQIDAGLLPGAVTLVARHGKVCHLSALGLKDIAKGAPSRVDGLYRIFSMTKPVTAVAMMLLWDEGRWDFDDPLAHHLPELANLRLVDGSAPRRQPTIRDFVTHSAGFAYGTALSDPNDPVDAAYRAADVWGADTLADMVERLGRCPLSYAPGSSWRYSIGMDIEGAIIERLSGQSLGQFMHARIFAPLGMEDTAFFTPPEKGERLAMLYLKIGSAPLTPFANPLLRDHASEPSLASGGAGLVSTIGDYARFAQMLLDRGRPILSEAAAEQLMSNHLPSALLDQGFTAGHQQVRPGIGMGVNGAVFTDPGLAGVPVGKGTYQWDGAAGTWFWVDPENDMLFVGMTHVMSLAAPPLQRRTQAMMAEALELL